ncbi:MAG TPA: DUF2752 domain-containing protein [Bacteroidia bacterium]|nr:DUF2752 domain-containing protein [Bacteroidia bacterium]
MITWLNHHLLPCAFKTLFGIDCPICGFQRAFLLLLQGKFTDSFKVYPPLIPCLLFLAIVLAYVINKKAIKPTFIKISSYSVLAIIFVNYFFKLSLLLFS